MRGEEQRSEVRGNGQEAQTDKKVRKRKIESQKKFKRLKKVSVKSVHATLWIKETTSAHAQRASDVVFMSGSR